MLHLIVEWKEGTLHIDDSILIEPGTDVDGIAYHDEIKLL